VTARQCGDSGIVTTKPLIKMRFFENDSGDSEKSKNPFRAPIPLLRGMRMGCRGVLPNIAYSTVTTVTNKRNNNKINGLVGDNDHDNDHDSDRVPCH
jgi:hypothetical protein